MIQHFVLAYSLVLEVTYYAQNNAILMWKSLIVLYHTAEGRGGVFVTQNATCAALSLLLFIVVSKERP